MSIQDEAREMARDLRAEHGELIISDLLDRLAADLDRTTKLLHYIANEMPDSGSWQQAARNLIRAELSRVVDQRR